MPPSPLSTVVRHIRALAERGPGATLPDQLLLERFIHQHDEAAFASLVRRHGGVVLGVARRILHDVHAAEDVFQNTFLTLARRAASIRKREALPSWLYGVAARLASQIRLQEGRRRRREHAAAKPSCEDVAEATAWRELGALLDEELQRLPEKCRAPLVLINFSGLTQEAAARQLEWSLGTLRRRLERGKRLLHDRLLRHGVSLSIGLLATAIAQSAVEAASAPPLAAFARTTATQRAGSLAAHAPAGSTGTDRVAGSPAHAGGDDERLSRTVFRLGTLHRIVKPCRRLCEASLTSACPPSALLPKTIRKNLAIGP